MRVATPPEPDTDIADLLVGSDGVYSEDQHDAA